MTMVQWYDNVPKFLVVVYDHQRFVSRRHQYETRCTKLLWVAEATWKFMPDTHARTIEATDGRQNTILQSYYRDNVRYEQLG
jgi:hypothetical protein